ncbi:MAG: hypothetical protein WAN65_17530 [Candidatus Sulfotelmatobacter sp.]
MPKKLVHSDGCVCGRCYRQQKNRQYRVRQANGTTKQKDWMDKRAEEVWEKLKSEEPRPFRMFRSPLVDL